MPCTKRLKITCNYLHHGDCQRIGARRYGRRMDRSLASFEGATPDSIFAMPFSRGVSSCKILMLTSTQHLRECFNDANDVWPEIA